MKISGRGRRVACVTAAGLMSAGTLFGFCFDASAATISSEKFYSFVAGQNAWTQCNMRMTSLMNAGVRVVTLCEGRIDNVGPHYLLQYESSGGGCNSVVDATSSEGADRARPTC